MALLKDAKKVYVEDALAKKVYLGSTLVWSPAWTPADISGLGLWLEADRITGVSDGGSLTTWFDASGKGRNATALATPPTWRQAGMNGKPSVQFTASPITYMKVQGWGTALSGKTQYTMFQVLTTSEVASYPVITSAPANSTWTFLTEFGPNGDLYWGHPGNYYSLYKANVLDKPMVYSYVLGGGAGKFYKDGTEIAAAPSGIYPQVGDIGADVLLCGYYNATLGLTGHVAALLWYDRALSDVERQKVEDYLRQKYLPWTPTRIPGLGLWIDPKQDLFADGERIASYREHSEAQFTLTAQPGYEPVFRAGAHPYIEFVNPAYGLAVAASTFNPGLVGLTMIAVGHRTVGGQTAPMVVVVGPNNDGYEIRYAGDKMEFTASYLTSFVDIVHPTITGVVNDYLMVARVDVPSAKTDLWVDAVKYTGPAPTRMRNVPEMLLTGRREGGYPYLGTVKEALVYAGPISDADLTSLTNYLKTKHNMSF